MVRRKQTQPVPLLKKVWVEDYTTTFNSALIGGGGFFASLDGVNWVLQSTQMSSLLSYMSVPKEVYITIAVIGLMAFIAKGRDA